MVIGLDSFMIWSENYKELAKWYQETFDLGEAEELELPNDSGLTFKFANNSTLFWIGYHDKVHGKAKDPYRVMVGFSVTDIEKMCTELKEKNVEFEAELTISPTGDYKVATIKDPEGNIVQLFDLTPIK